jgi:hypothetical protein
LMLRTDTRVSRHVPITASPGAGRFTLEEY